MEGIKNVRVPPINVHITAIITYDRLIPRKSIFMDQNFRDTNLKTSSVPCELGLVWYKNNFFENIRTEREKTNNVKKPVVQPSSRVERDNIIETIPCETNNVGITLFSHSIGAHRVERTPIASRVKQAQTVLIGVRSKTNAASEPLSM
jgi:hypothetical protein